MFFILFFQQSNCGLALGPENEIRDSQEKQHNLLLGE